MAKNRLTDGQEGAFDYTIRRKINNNFNDVSLCNTQFDAVTGTTGVTLTNVLGMLTDAMERNQKYRFSIYLDTIATANSGLKLGLKQSVASMLTDMEARVSIYTAAGIATSRFTSITDAANFVASTTAILAVEVQGVFTVANIDGTKTLQLQAAQNAAHADTTSVYVNSRMEVTKIATN